MKRSKTSKIINDPYIDNLNSKQKRTTIVTKNNSSLEKLNYRKTINIYSINAPSLTLEDSTIGRYSNINDFHDLYEKEKEDEILKNINISDYINSIYFFEVIDNDYISNNKKYLMNTIFSLYFIDAFFKNELFEKMKNYYLNNYNNVKIGTKNLNYPSKYKNYNNGLEPGMFLKQYNNFYNNKYFPISHPYFINYMNDKHLYSKYIKLYPREIPNSLDIIKPADFRTNVELIGINKYYFGEILAYCSNNKEKYLLFQEKVFNLDCEYENLLDDTKNENIEFIFSLSFLINHEKLKFKKKDEKNNDEQKKTQKKRNNKTIIILFSEIEEIIERRFLLMWQGVEIFLKNGKSYFFNAYNENNKKDFLDFLKNYKELTKLMHMKDFLCTEKEITKKWKEYHFSTYEYLLLVNKYSSRSFNDNSQYPIFPWLLIKDLYNLETINEKDYLTEEYLKKKSKIKEEDENYNYLKFLRQLNYPVCIQKIETIKKMIKKYIDSDEKYKNHLCIHYSTSSYVYYYLMRQEPYSDLMIKLQNYQQENPNRMFSDIEESLKTLETGKDSREIIPEFFSRIEFLINLNCEYFGMKTNKTIVDDIIINCLEENEKINPFFQYIHFIIEHKKLLNSKIISIHIDEWIDNIFGINQIPAKKKDRENSCNIFFKSSYEKLYNLQKKLNKCIDKIKEYEKENKEKNNTSDIIKYKNKLIFKYMSKINSVLNFGQTPYQVFKEKHIKRKLCSFDEDNEDNDTDALGLISNIFTNQNISCEMLKIDNFIYFQINPTLNKIFVIGKNRCLSIIHTELFNKEESTLYSLVNHCNLQLPQFLLGDIIKTEFGNDYYIYKIKYAFDSFDDIKDNPMYDNLNNINLDINTKDIFHTYGREIIDNIIINNEKKKNKIKKKEKNENIYYWFITCRYIDKSFKIHRFLKYKKIKKIIVDKPFSFLCEDLVCSCCVISFCQFLIGLKNGKLIQFYIENKENNDDKKTENNTEIKIKMEKYIQAHKGKINIIEINKRLGLIITCGDDNYILIRKLYDFELLSPIKIKPKYIITMVKISPLNFIYIICYNKEKKTSVIYGYTLTGLKFAKSNFGFYDNIDFTMNGNIVTLKDYNELCILSGSSLKKIKMNEEDRDFEEYNKINDEIKGSIWVRFDFFKRKKTKDNIYNKIITYYKKEKKNENLATKSVTNNKYFD